MDFNFNRKSFFDLKNNYNLDQLIKKNQNLIIDYQISNNFLIDDISSLDRHRINSLLFLDKKFDFNDLSLKNICIISENRDFILNKFQNFILVKNLNASYQNIINELFIHDDLIDYKDDFELIDNSLISKSSYVHPTAKIFPKSVIGKGVTIGKNCIIKNNVVIKNSIIKDNVTICDNTVLGSTGFGFDLHNMGAKNILPQIGVVLIDENTHIGSNCTIDRAKIDVTYIGKNSMIDNLVHIAHNVIVGNNACIAAQSGISGSVTIGNNLISGGQTGYAGHIKIGNNVIVAAKSGVTKNIKDHSAIAGFPAVDIKEWKKKIIREKKNGYK